MSSTDALSWIISIERGDEEVVVRKFVPNDELEYGIDAALAEARDLEQRLG